jgi:hypothetical protein
MVRTALSNTCGNSHWRKLPRWLEAESCGRPAPLVDHRPAKLCQLLQERAFEL